MIFAASARLSLSVGPSVGVSLSASITLRISVGSGERSATFNVASSYTRLQHLHSFFISPSLSLRYCEVGWFLKNPVSPIWILGSETHFTLCFSPEKKLIVHDSPISNGRRAFKQLDPEGNGFISGKGVYACTPLC